MAGPDRAGGGGGRAELPGARSASIQRDSAAVYGSKTGILWLVGVRALMEARLTERVSSEESGSGSGGVGGEDRERRVDCGGHEGEISETRGRNPKTEAEIRNPKPRPEIRSAKLKAQS
eukprot:765749-Rhodomonas_salina.1